MKKETKLVKFKWLEDDDSIALGVPEEVSSINGNWRDGGCELKFKTSPLSIGLEEKFSLYLYAEDMRSVTLAVWRAYLQTEPDRARKDLTEIFTTLQQTKE